MPLVIDASVTMSWCFEDESTTASELVLERLRVDTAIVPGIWPLEVANVLLVAERGGRLAEAQSARFVELLVRLPIRVEPTSGDVPSVLNLGRVHGLSAYDASYLLLAERRGVALATADLRLGDAARTAGVEVLGVE